jgi:beta-lactamase class A
MIAICHNRHTIVTSLSVVITIPFAIALSAASASAQPHPASVAQVPVCVTKQPAHKARAARLAKAINAAIRSRFTDSDRSYDPFDHVGVAVHDDYLGLDCWYHMRQHFYSASAVKAAILAALLRKTQEQHRGLTAREKADAWLMITQSNNAAATRLWNDVGLRGMQHFFNLAGMKATKLNSWGAWGLTQITAHDETLLLRLLMTHGSVLTDQSRRYELYLMHHVIASQTWGVRAGAPKLFSWHIKNGWAPLLSRAWTVNSIGCFRYKVRDYTIVVLTNDNPGSGAGYGIATIEAIARVINRALNPNSGPVWPGSVPQPSWQVPDEVIPARH